VKQFFSLMSSLLETLYLLRSPANATRLTTALERSKAGTIQPQASEDLYKRYGLEENDTDNQL
jgi:antitoxin YefM